jgi:hypothetical protein
MLRKPSATHSAAPPAALSPSTSLEPTDVHINGRRIISRLLVACVSIEIAFVLLDYFVNYGRLTTIGPIRRMFNITREDGLASWFGITQTLLVGLTAWFIWLVRRAQPDVKRWSKIGWFILAICITYMAVDDGATIHERLGSTMKAIQNDAQQPELEEEASVSAGSQWWFPSYHWQVLFLPFFGAMGIFILAFLWRELREPRLRLWVFACIGCFVLAVGLDFIEGLDHSHKLNMYSKLAERFDFQEFTRSRFNASEFDTLRHFSKSVEETLEMLGMTLLWVTFLTHLTRIAPEIRLRTSNS